MTDPNDRTSNGKEKSLPQYERPMADRLDSLRLALKHDAVPDDTLMTVTMYSWELEELLALACAARDYLKYMGRLPMAEGEEYPRHPLQDLVRHTTHLILGRMARPNYEQNDPGDTRRDQGGVA